MTEPVRSAVVVGGARGIGRAIVEQLALADLARRVVVADLNEVDARAVAEGLRQRGAQVEAVGVDVRDSASIDQLVQSAGPTDKLAIAAGIFRATPTLEATVAEFEEVFGVNTIGCFQVAQRFASDMVGNGGGSIVAVASVAARMPRVRQAAYSASKAALRQALRVLALEVVDRGVRINTVSPGPTETEMMLELARDHSSLNALALGELETFRPRVPAGRVADADDVASAVCFLLSDASRHIMLSDLVVDGGEMLGM